MRHYHGQSAVRPPSVAQAVRRQSLSVDSIRHRLTVTAWAQGVTAGQFLSFHALHCAKSVQERPLASWQIETELSGCS